MPTNKPQKSTLWIVGTPLSDEGKLSAEAIACINKADLVIAESKKVGFPYLKQTEFSDSTPVCFLDNLRDAAREDLFQKLTEASQQQKQVVLFSDTGMPLLFDPGEEVLAFAKKLKFSIRSVCSATSWGSACALSGWNPPFLVLGFLDRDLNERKKQLGRLKGASHHTVLMDTPYRFESLLSQVAEVLGGDRQCFLAWEISKSDEQLIWGSIKELQREAKKLSLKKGEFILIIRQDSRVK